MSDRASTLSGIPIPQWMKSKTVSGFDPSTLSPPTYDDEFIQIRFHNKDTDNTVMGPELYGGRLSDRPPNLNRPHGVDDGFNGLKSDCANSVVTCAQKLLGVPQPQRQRRNSKSLPASPLGSPESRRRRANRFFTLDEDASNNGSTSSLLDAISRDPEIRAKSSIPDYHTQQDILGPKPSEYREMNFWSPTSM